MGGKLHQLPRSLVEQCLAADDWMRTVVGTSSMIPYNYDVIHLNIEEECGNIITIIYIVDSKIYNQLYAFLIE
jgi:hypothetical protein